MEPSEQLLSSNMLSWRDAKYDSYCLDHTVKPYLETTAASILCVPVPQLLMLLVEGAVRGLKRAQCGGARVKPRLQPCGKVVGVSHLLLAAVEVEVQAISTKLTPCKAGAAPVATPLAMEGEDVHRASRQQLGDPVGACHTRLMLPTSVRRAMSVRCQCAVWSAQGVGDGAGRRGLPRVDDADPILGAGEARAAIRQVAGVECASSLNFLPAL